MMRCLIFLAALIAPAANAAPLTYEVIRTSDKSFAANIVLLKGEKKAILMDGTLHPCGCAPGSRGDS